jgi:glutamyl-tRNA synthetase
VSDGVYRGRIAPTPTGDMHAGHARTFVAAWRRARDAGGAVVLRVEDLDPLRCRPEWAARAIEDLAWLGVTWDEGPVFQSARRAVYEGAWRALRDAGLVYPSAVSRRDVRDAAHAPHEDEEDAEPLFPPALRPPPGAGATPRRRPARVALPRPRRRDGALRRRAARPAGVHRRR